MQRFISPTQVDQLPEFADLAVGSHSAGARRLDPGGMTGAILAPSGALRNHLASNAR